MIGIIPAAGKGERIGSKCKSLEMYKGNELIFYPIIKMVEAKVKEIIIVHNGPELPQVVGTEFREVPIKYVEQVERKGIAHAIGLCEKLVDGRDMLVILGDIYFDGELLAMKGIFGLNVNMIASFGGQVVNDMNDIKESYGVKGEEIIEKPEDVTGFERMLGLGIYMFRPTIFDYIKKTPIGRNNEVQITDTLNLIPEGKIGMTLLFGKYKNVTTKEDLK